MNRLVWVGILLAVLLAQSALPVAASCFAGTSSSMPCCKPGSDCASAGLNTPSCCGIDAPTDRQQDADRHRGTPPPTSDRQVANVPNTHAPLAVDPATILCDIAGFPPRDPGRPIYLRLGSLLR